MRILSEGLNRYSRLNTNQKQGFWVIAGLTTAAAVGGYVIWDNRDMIIADREASKALDLKIKAITPPPMRVAETDFNLRYYMRNCNYKEEPRPHKYKLQTNWQNIALQSPQERAQIPVLMEETYSAAKRIARARTDRSSTAYRPDIEDVDHTKSGLVCHGLSKSGGSCTDIFTRGVELSVRYKYETKHKECTAHDEDGHCTSTRTYYTSHTGSVTRGKTFETKSGADVHKDMLADAYRQAVLDSVAYGIDQSPSKAKCKPVSNYTGGGGAGGSWDLSPEN